MKVYKLYDCNSGHDLAIVDSEKSVIKKNRRLFKK